MKHPFIIVVLIIVVGIAVWLVSPFFYSREVNESLEDIVGDMKVVTMEEIEKTEAEKSALPEALEKKIEPTVMEKNETVPSVKTQATLADTEAKVEAEPQSQPQQPTEPMAVIAGQGSFQGLAGHDAEGKATLIKAGDTYYVRFEDDFRVTNGPDLYVDLGRAGEHDGAARLGRLKGNVGGQNYELPPGIDVSQYSEVWVWCRAFSVPFAKASWR